MTAVTAAERILMGLGISDPKEIDLEAIAWSRGAVVDLLLPNYLLHLRLRKIKRVTLAVAREIREEYAASLTATLIKIVQSNRFPLIVVCHTKKGRRWFKRAQMVPGWWFPLEQLDRESFAADMLFNGAAEQTWPRKIGADAWFGFRNCDRHEIEEQSLMLPGDEVLTVLTIPENGLG